MTNEQTHEKPRPDARLTANPLACATEWTAYIGVTASDKFGRRKPMYPDKPDGPQPHDALVCAARTMAALASAPYLGNYFAENPKIQVENIDGPDYGPGDFPRSVLGMPLEYEEVEREKNGRRLRAVVRVSLRFSFAPEFRSGAELAEFFENVPSNSEGIYSTLTLMPKIEKWTAWERMLFNRDKTGNMLEGRGNISMTMLETVDETQVRMMCDALELSPKVVREFAGALGDPDQAAKWLKAADAREETLEGK